jgi:PAS domain S-box-containing protein/putative nucleotidyltransferase with HDIG domain
LKILAVDDKEENLYLLETLLKGGGYEVVSAVNGAEALERLRAEDFDMIISDVLMPVMDGFQLCREVKKDRKLKKIAFVFYTATYTEPSDEEFALSLGAERFIVKPTEPDVFMKIIKEVVKIHETGALKAPKAPIEDEIVYLKEYNERLIGKLEDKILELEKVNIGLKESEKKYKNLIDNANDAVIVFDRTGYISFVNPRFCEMTGYSIDEAKKLHFNMLIHPDDLNMCTEYFRRREAGEKIPRNYELRLLSKTGKTVYIDNNVSTLEREGEITGVLTIMRDITERKMSEEALKEASKKRKELESIVNKSPAVVFLWRADEGWPVEFVSDNVQQFGYAPEDFYSGRILFTSIVHPDDRERVASEIARYTQEGRRDFIQEYRIITKSGDVRVLDDRTWVRYDSNGVITHYQGIVLDSTKRKQAEDKLKESFEKLRKAMDGIIQAMALTAETRDPYTAGHQQRVARLAHAIARELRLPEEQIEGIRVAGVLHDMGKIYVPAEILSKPGRITEIEFNMIKTHPKVGHDILNSIEFPWPIARIVLQHHERMDGSGYPSGLSGKNIMLESRILAVADVIEAMASHRPYRPTLGIDKALEEISEKKGILYDPDVVDACLKLFNEKRFTLE